jgi:hypothetical protein
MIIRFRFLTFLKYFPSSCNIQYKRFGKPVRKGVTFRLYQCYANFYKKLCIRTLWLEKGNILSFTIRIRNTHTHWFIIDSFIQHVLCFVFICLHSYRTRIYMQIHI